MDKVNATRELRRTWNNVDDGDDDRTAEFMYRRQLNARADLPQTYAFTTTINVRGVNSLMTVVVRKVPRTAILVAGLKNLFWAKTT